MKLRSHRLEAFGFIFQLSAQAARWRSALAISIFASSSILFSPSAAISKKAEEVKGLLKELQMEAGNESANELKAFQSEALITKAENKAIENLERIIAKNKGSSNEADLHYRLAELHMRRSKSGRFFELHQDNKTLKWSSFPVRIEKGSASIKKAISIYTKIQKQFPKFIEMDYVTFNKAFALQQINQISESIASYEELIKKFPKSSALADAHLAVGELYYDQKRFAMALDHFMAIEKYPESRVYNYGLYKAAWAHYNLKNDKEAIAALLLVLKRNPPNSENDGSKSSVAKQNLRKEALRDLSLFVGETKKADELYGFFKAITTPEELTDTMSNLSSLYESHSRYREMESFLGEFIADQPQSPFRVKAHMRLVNAFESVKERNKVLAQLKEAALLCSANSHPDQSSAHRKWRNIMPPDQIEESCDKSFRREGRELAAKWWETWQKNKEHKEFTGLTKQCFEILLIADSRISPDTKTRFAYAELLFQMNDFKGAAEQYFVVFESKNQEFEHDSLYASLVSLGKIRENQTKQKASDKDIMITRLNQIERSEIYLKKFPTEKHHREVQFALATYHYENKDYEKALIGLQSYLPQEKSDKLTLDEYTEKAEDLTLDIYNLQSRFKDIQSLATNILKRKLKTDRQKLISKILEETELKLTEKAVAEEKDGKKAAELWTTFSKKYTGSGLAVEAEWQAVSQLFKADLSLDAADKALSFYESNPKDKRAQDALKEAANTYLAAGYFSKAAGLLEIQARISDQKSGEASGDKSPEALLEKAADLYAMDGAKDKTKGIYQQLIRSAEAGAGSKANKEKLSRLFSKVFELSRSESGGKLDLAEQESLEKKIVSLDVEPFATEILVKRAEQTLQQKHYSKAFDQAKKLISRGGPKDLKARARLVQAAILEKEFTEQSLKAKDSRFALVLALKTEKFEKAHSAYTQSLSWAEEKNTQIRVLEGLDRSYRHYIDGLSTMNLPQELTPQEQAAMRQEIDTLLAPLKEKRDENYARLAKVTIPSEAKTSALEASSNQIPQLALKFPEISEIKYFIPKEYGSIDPIPLEGNAKLCTDKSKEPELAMAHCLLVNNRSVAETLLRQLLNKKDTQARGYFLGSILAEQQKLNLKAQWLAEKSLELNKVEPSYRLQVIRTKALNEEVVDYAALNELHLQRRDLKRIQALVAYQKGDYTSVLLKLENSSPEQLTQEKMAEIYARALAIVKKPADGVAFLNQCLKKDPKNTNLWRELAVQREYLEINFPDALVAYQKSFESTADDAQRDWLSARIKTMKDRTRIGSLGGSNE